MITTYTSSKGKTIKITEMVSGHLGNAIAKLKRMKHERESFDGDKEVLNAKALKQQEELLEALEKEYEEREKELNGKKHF